MTYSKRALVFGWRSCFSSTDLVADANTGKADLTTHAEATQVLNLIQALHPDREQLEALCYAQSQKFIPSQGYWQPGALKRTLPHSAKSKGFARSSLFSLDVNKNAATRAQAR